MPGVDKPTWRVVALIVLLILGAAALRGYVPAQGRAAPTEPGGGRAALVFVVVLLSAALALLAVAVIARLRDPRVVAPNRGELSEMLGRHRGRPSWRVLLIGLGLIMAWLLLTTLLIRYLVPHPGPSSAPGPDPVAPPSGQPAGSAPQQHPRNDSGDMVGILLAATIPMMLLIVVGSVLMSRRRWRATARAAAGNQDHDRFDDPESAPPSESLVRAAELGLAEIEDLNREPREAIIACYAAMESELANVPGAAPQDFDTPTEVLVRAVEQRALQADNAERLVALFEEARFSPHVMDEGHRDVAENALRLVLAELRSAV